MSRVFLLESGAMSEVSSFAKWLSVCLLSGCGLESCCSHIKVFLLPLKLSKIERIFQDHEHGPCTKTSLPF